MAGRLTAGAILAACLAVAGCGSDDGGRDAGPPLGPGHSAGNWDRQHVGARANARFGAGLSVGPDADGDGLGDLLVGAPSFENTGAGPGEVFLYSGRTGELVHTWSAGGDDDLFGACVSLGPDVDGDGLADVLVGAPDAGGRDGHAYLYSGATGALLQEWIGQDTGRLGARCALGPDIDGDGRGDIAVSEPAATYDSIDEGDVVVSRRGRVYVYSGGLGEPLWIWEAPERGTDGLGGILSMGWAPPDGYREEIVVGIQGVIGPSSVSVMSTRTGETLRQWTGEVDVFASARLGPDATGDGEPDVATVWANEVNVWYGGRDGNAASMSFPDADYVGIAFGPDATGDRLGDLVVTQWSRPGGHAVRAQLVRGRSFDRLAEWELPTNGIAAVSLGPDMDGDGLGDFAVADYTAPDGIDPLVGRVWVFLSATVTP